MKNTRTGPHAAGTAHQQPKLTSVAAATGAAPPRGRLRHTPDAALRQIAEVQLVDGKTAAQIGGSSTSWWHEKVAEGIAPQPEFRAPRFTRWRLSKVVSFWRQYRPRDDRAAEVMKQAVKASAKAGERRRAKATASRVEGE